MPTASEVHQFDLEIAPALREFMCNYHTDLNDCVDWVCNVFDLNATDFIIDRVADEFEEFFGSWHLRGINPSPFFCTFRLKPMGKFLFGIVTGIVIATVGFNGIAAIGNRAVQGIQDFAENASN